MASSDQPDSLGEVLLAWVRSFDDTIGKIEQLGELSDGRALWAILQDVDPEYFSGSLPEPDISLASDWTRKWQNLKHLEKQLSTYYRDVCNVQDQGAATHGPDLKAIASDSSISNLERLIMEIIRAAMASPESNQRMGKRLLGLGNEHAMAIAYEIRSMNDVETIDSETVSRDESAYQSEQEMAVSEKVGTNGSRENGGLFGDPLLEREEELLQAQATIEMLQATHKDVQKQLQQLRQDKEQLQEAFDAYRSEINNKGRKAGGDDEYKKLQRQADSDRAYIDDLENQLESTKEAVDSYERQLKRYKDESEASQKLRDDLQMLRSENEDLGQKVKANENLKKKIQALQEQEKTNASLRDEIKQASERLEDFDRLKHVQAQLEKEIIEKKGLIRNQEYQINELSTTRKHAMYEAGKLRGQLDEMRERQHKDHEALQELRARLQERGEDDEIDLEPPEPTKSAAETEESERKTDVRKTDENKHLVDKVALLEKQLEAADARLKQASERNASFEDHRENATSEKEKAERQLEEQETMIINLRKQLEDLAKLPREEAPQDVAALQRENRLMTTAWYDLSSRLRNNGVSLGRRRQEPKSWIGKQRQLVGPNSGLSGGR